MGGCGDGCCNLGYLGKKYQKIVERQAWPIRYDEADAGLVKAPEFG